MFLRGVSTDPVGQSPWGVGGNCVRGAAHHAIAGYHKESNPELALEAEFD